MASVLIGIITFVVLLPTNLDFQILPRNQRNQEPPAIQKTAEPAEEKTLVETKQDSISEPEILFVGPRENIPEDAPKAYGFWSFAMPIPGILSRSGQPLISEFKWLKDQGWKGIIDLRIDGEYDEISDDAKLKGFNDLNFNYLRLPMFDGVPPTNQQAEEFLAFVNNPENQPVHVHCRGGIGRTGAMVALYRYAVRRWPMEKAIKESRLFQGGVSDLQKKWLEDWIKNHEPGSHAI